MGSAPRAVQGVSPFFRAALLQAGCSAVCSMAALVSSTSAELCCVISSISRKLPFIMGVKRSEGQ